jgi:hypothetical protein
MSVAGGPLVGVWSVTIQTPFGEQVVALEFPDESSGTGRYGAESIPLSSVATSGDHATWTVGLTEPLKVTLKCAVTIDGNTMSGSASAGFFGRFQLRGIRSA